MGCSPEWTLDLQNRGGGREGVAGRQTRKENEKTPPGGGSGRLSMHTLRGEGERDNEKKG